MDQGRSAASVVVGGTVNQPKPYGEWGILGSKFGHGRFSSRSNNWIGFLNFPSL
ncbi:hypothetical protein LINPERPRIM_LOCUS16921 [Linum perenne]